MLSDGALATSMTETVEIPKAKLDRLETLAPLADLADELGGVEKLIQGIKRGLEFAEFRPEAARDIAELKQELASNESTEETKDTNSSPSAKERPENQIERMAGLPGDVAEESLHENSERAHHLLQNVMEYSQSTPKGRVLFSGDIKRVLTSKEGGTFYQTVHRVMNRLAEWGAEVGVEQVRGESGERRVVIPNQVAGRIHRLANRVVSTPG